MITQLEWQQIDIKLRLITLKNSVNLIFEYSLVNFKICLLSPCSNPNYHISIDQLGQKQIE